MKLTRSQFGPYKEKLFFSKEEIDRICCEALAEVGLLPTEPSPIRVDRFVEKKFKSSIEYTDFSDGVLGCTVFDKEGTVKGVGVSASLDDGTQTGGRRVRSTLAHEAGHGLMHQILFIEEGGQLRLPQNENFDLRNSRIMCRSTDFEQGGSSGRWWEYQANRAIGGLLLPKQLLELALGQFLKNAGSMGRKCLLPDTFAKAKVLVADTFDVNPIVAEIRLKESYIGSGQMEL